MLNAHYYSGTPSTVELLNKDTLKSGHLSNQDTYSRPQTCPHLGVQMYTHCRMCSCVNCGLIIYIFSFFFKLQVSAIHNNMSHKDLACFIL